MHVGLTEREVKSPTSLTGVSANSSAILKESSFRSMSESKLESDSSGAPDSPLSIKTKCQSGTEA